MRAHQAFPGEVREDRSGVLLGDVSQNGTIAAYDAALVLEDVVGAVTFTPSQQQAADVTGDGTVSTLDAS